MRRSGLVGAVVAVVVGLPAPAQAATVAVWHMDESSGTTMTDSVGTNTGTLVNVTTGVAGFSGTAYRFDGADSYVSVPSSSTLNPGTAPITFTAYVRYTTTPPSGTTMDYDVMRKGTASDSAEFYKLEIRSDNRAVCRFVGSKTSSSGLLIHTGPRLNDGQWHSLTCKKTSSRIKLIVDGTTYAKTGTVGSISNSGPLTLGAKPGSPFTDYYKGDLDEVSVSIG
jgi:Concanavalin A-like lectin/glucanases superfamily